MHSNRFFFLLLGSLTFYSVITFAQTPPQQEQPGVGKQSDTVIQMIDKASGYAYWKIYNGVYVSEEGHMLGGKKTGDWLTYYPNGVLLALIQYENGMKNGIYIECEKSGAVEVQEFYRNDLLDGEQRQYFTSKNVRILKSTREFKNGLLDGVSTEYNDMGVKQSAVTYAEGKKDGTATWYFSTGQLAMEQHYKADSLSGQQTIYNVQGIVVSQGNYVDNKKEGEWLEYNDNATLKSEGRYTDNRKTGEWKYYDGNGKLIKTEKL